MVVQQEPCHGPVALLLDLAHPLTEQSISYLGHKANALDIIAWTACKYIEPVQLLKRI